MPANNKTFWEKKLLGSSKRDLIVTKTLRGEGWRVIRIWEHDIAECELLTSKLRKIFGVLKDEAQIGPPPNSVQPLPGPVTAT